MNAIVRQRAKVSRLWAAVDAAPTSGRFRRQFDKYRYAKGELANMQLSYERATNVARDGRCPECHKAISLTEAEAYR